MKGVSVLVFITCVLMLVAFASSDVEVFSDTFEIEYPTGSIIKGTIDLEVSEIPYNSFLTSSLDESILLSNFLDLNVNSGNFSYDCSPLDCSNGYSTSSSGETDLVFSLNINEDKYVGFVIYGNNVNIDSVNFTIYSDFEREEGRPLEATFFENEDWQYGVFSEEYSKKDYGCYDVTSAVSSDALIGTTKYCEQIYSRETNSLFIGAKVEASLDSIELEMSVYDSFGSSFGDCTYDPSSSDGCAVTLETGSIPEGNYSICVGSTSGTTGYKVFTDSSGPYCGYFDNGVENAENSLVDYGIFAQIALYENSSALGDFGLDVETFGFIADDIVSTRYGRDCSNGCFLPIRFKGLPQNVGIKDVRIEYTSSGNLIEDEVYALEIFPAIVSFDGVIDLALTGFNTSGTGEFSIDLDSEEILRRNIIELPAPVVVSVTPTNPPAGVPVTFFVSVSNSIGQFLTYNWDFGDGTTSVTNIPNVTHIYPNVSPYILSVEVLNSGDLGSKKSFNLLTLNPKSSVNITLEEKRFLFEGFVKNIRGNTAWYSEALENVIKVQDYNDLFNSLDNLNSQAFTDNDYLVLAGEVYSLDVPVSLIPTRDSGLSFFTREEDVNPEIIVSFAGGISGTDLEGYSEGIVRWQDENIVSTLDTSLYSVQTSSGSINSLFRSYSVSVKSSYDQNSYFVINKPFSEVEFRKTVEAERVGDSTLIVLGPFEEKTFEFYIEDSEEATFFVSPRLSDLVLELTIDPTCNYNNICEELEDHNTCRADCKPFKLAGFYIFLAILFVLFVYGVLQYWYKVHYENYLFGGNRKELFNLINYVTNARSRGIEDSKIEKGLSKQGWSMERVDYIMRKSRGEKTGMFEVFPFEKIAAWNRKRNADKAYSKSLNGGVMTGTSQQNKEKVNKSPYMLPRSVR